MLKFRLSNKIKKISIRGRFALGVKCVEQYVEENNIKSIWIDRLLVTLWEFTTSDKLDNWDETIKDLDPRNITDSHPDNKSSDYKTLNDTDFQKLKDFYLSLDKDFIDMIGNVIEIGTGNLYGGTGKYSNFTLQPTLELINIAERKLKKIPEIKNFEFSKFSEQHGWGDKFGKERFD